jgi:N-acetylmuramic acid 6-phosphate etherase
MNEVDEFLSKKQYFQLGGLSTESPNPLTMNLSQLAQNDLDAGLRIMRQIDLAALRKTLAGFDDYQELFRAVAETLEEGQRIYLVGCGATGRLSLSLEHLWRRRNPSSDQVRSLMAGGDVALVHSLEGFEDFPQFGARHLKQLGFANGDLVIATTEGGETPYVIGAVELAALDSRRAPYFLYCNSRKILIEKVERSKRVLENPRIKSLCLEVGPMALSGSTRMQASTVLMLVVGLALEFGADWKRAERELRTWIRFLEKSQAPALQRFILREAETYQEGNFTCYTAEELAITVFADTTERAPTFNLAPFDNPAHRTDRFSLTYISIPSANTALESWQHLLGRDPRPLEWPEVHPKSSADYLLSFDFSRKARDFREQLLSGAKHFDFWIGLAGDHLCLRFRDNEEHFPISDQTALFAHLTAKMLLNIHSTLVFGRLGRFEGNLMTWLYPSNGKLVDRAARYTQILLEQRGYSEFDYDSIVRAQFACKADLSPEQSIVHRTVERLIRGHAKEFAGLLPVQLR